MSEPKKRGRWKAGESGNPNGRPKGTGEVSKLRDAIKSHVPAILERLTTQALDGDVQAARLLLDRSVAPLRAVEPTQSLALPDGSLTDQGRAVLSAVSMGDLAAIGALARVAEIDELTERIEKLEGHHART